MFKDWLSGELRSWYVQSPHKDRIDFVGARLQETEVPACGRPSPSPRVGPLRTPLGGACPSVTVLRSRPGSPALPRGALPQRESQPTARDPVVDPDLPRDGRRRSILPPCPRPTTADQCPVPAGRPPLSGLPPEASGCRAKTVSKRAFQLTLFTGYLERAGISTWQEMQPVALRTFLATQLTDKRPGTRRSYASTLRGFLRWAFLQGLLKRDFSAAAASVRQYRLAGIPDLLTDDEVAALLQAVDRSTALGKRDYAILLLAARLGMRPGDIRQLQLDHINWRSQQIIFPQAKTGRLLVLPLLSEVSDALIAYLRHGRPPTEVSQRLCAAPGSL